MGKITIVYENDQWMLQNDDGRLFIVEKLAPNHYDRGDDSMSTDERIKNNEGYWYHLKHLAKKDCNDYTPVYHIGTKTWVDVDLFEDAVHAAIRIFELTPDYNVDAEFEKVRRDNAVGGSPDDPFITAMQSAIPNMGKHPTINETD